MAPHSAASRSDELATAFPANGKYQDGCFGDGKRNASLTARPQGTGDSGHMLVGEPGDRHGGPGMSGLQGIGGSGPVGPGPRPDRVGDTVLMDLVPVLVYPDTVMVITDDRVGLVMV